MFHQKPRYTVDDCLKLLSISRGRFYESINDGKIKTYKIGRRRFIAPEALDKYVKECEQAAA